MFCQHCGTQVADGTRFCHSCGGALSSVQPAPQVQPVAPPPVQPVIPVQTYIPQPTPAPANSLADQGFARKVRQTVRQVGGSPLFLIATICFTLATVLSLISAFLNFAPAAVLSVISSIPAILIMSGLWATYCTCTNRSNRTGTAGMTIIFVVTILHSILPSLALLLMFVVFAISAVTMSGGLLEEMGGLEISPQEEGAVMAVFIMLLVVIAVALFFILFYTIKVCSTISKVKTTIRTGKPNRKVSGFVAVMCFIVGSFSILGGLSSLIAPAAQEIYIEDYGYITMAGPSGIAVYLSAGASILSALTQIFMGALIFSYKGKMRLLEEEEARLIATPAPVQYAAPVQFVPVQPAPVVAPAPITAPQFVAAEEPQPAPEVAPVEIPEPITAPEPVQEVTPEPAAEVTPEPAAEVTPEPIPAPAETVPEITPEPAQEAEPEENP